MEYKEQTNKKQMNKPKRNKNKPADTENRVVVTRWERMGRKAKCVKGMDCVVKNGN